jgi:thiamine-monophosphate kinase
MAELARLHNVAVIGGDVVAAPLVMLSPAVIGTAENILTRSAAVARDQIAVTGLLGASAAGLVVLQRGLKFDDKTVSSLREAHVKPHPRLKEGQILMHNEVKAAIDISDGLVSDLTKLCKASGVGARLFTEDIPIHPLVRTAFNEDSLNLALSGGEDYELLFTGSMEVIAKVKGLMPCPVTVIGEITSYEPGTVRLFDEHGNEVELEGEGWEHFAPRNDKYR